MGHTSTATRVRILDKETLNHRVHRWIVERPPGFRFVPGQAAEVSLDREGLRSEVRPFTFTSVPSDPTLEFTIKTYPSHDGVTDALADMAPGDHLLLGEPFGAIRFQGEGTFIAGGAGVTPFISILRERHAAGDLGSSRLFFGNRTVEDVFLRDELEALLPGRVHFFLSQDDAPFATRGRIGRAQVEPHCAPVPDRPVYLCGPPGMGEELERLLLDLGVHQDAIVHEDWGA